MSLSIACSSGARHSPFTALSDAELWRHRAVERDVLASGDDQAALQSFTWRFEWRIAGQEYMNPLPTARQQRILRLMRHDDRIWEVAGKSYRSLYNEKLGRPQRIPASTVEEMEQQGWIRRLENSNPWRLDGWELTEQGRAFVAQLRTRRPAKPRRASLE
jgi:hypothetical protein